MKLEHAAQSAFRENLIFPANVLPFPTIPISNTQTKNKMHKNRATCPKTLRRSCDLVQSPREEWGTRKSTACVQGWRTRRSNDKCTQAGVPVLLIRSPAFAQHTKSILATTKQRWVARPCGSCKGAGFSGVSARAAVERFEKRRKKK